MLRLTSKQIVRPKNKNSTTMSTMQLVPGDVILMKNDAYQGKRKVKDR